MGRARGGWTWISLRILVLGVLVLMFGFPVSVRAITGQEIVRRIQERFKEFKDFSSDFHQEFYWKLVEKTQGFRGKLYIKKPSKFRIENDKQVVVSDGKSIWIYSPENEQVIVDDYRKLEDSSSPERLLFRYSERYVPKYLGEKRVLGKSCYLIELTPKQEDAEFVQMKAWVDRKQWLTLKVECLDFNENMTTYTLSNVRIDSKLEDSLFRFVTPHGVDTVDMREGR